MVTRQDSNQKRLLRHKRVRAKISGTAERPRLCVYRSNDNIYAQIIDDTTATGVTLVSASTLEAEIKSQIADKNKKEAAYIIGKTIGERAKAKGITSIVFDRGGYRYMGRVEELAKGAREAGLDF